MWARVGALIAGLVLSGCALTPGRVGYIVHNRTAQPVVVETTSGKVRGVESPWGRAFLNIPFAAPPVGELRFRPPAPAASWQGVRDATRAGPICLQKTFPGAGRQSEDCLNLNIYAPSNADPAQPRPVMVWLYGGGFSTGNNLQYDPSRMAQIGGVLVVAPNYRLGAFGFMAHPSLRGRGEGAYALLDQQAALRWVAANIARFGGDPHNVTLFGELAGGFAICYQLVTPDGAGLFQRAIVESGSCLSPLANLSLADAEASGQRLAVRLGCRVEADVADCLRRASPRALLNGKSPQDGVLGLNFWSPAWGGDVLPEDPLVAYAAGRFAAVSLIDGTNRNEGRLFLYAERLQGRVWTRGGYEKAVRDAFRSTAPEVLAEYAATASGSFGRAYSSVVTDSTFACPALSLNAFIEHRLAAEGSPLPVYAYEFDDPRAATELPPLPFTSPLNAYHTGELAYVFQTPWGLADPADLNHRQRALSDRMQAYWAAFAATGDPNRSGQPLWPADMGAGPLTLAPAGMVVVGDFETNHHCRFWNAATKADTAQLNSPERNASLSTPSR